MDLQSVGSRGVWPIRPVGRRPTAPNQLVRAGAGNGASIASGDRRRRNSRWSSMSIVTTWNTIVPADKYQIQLSAKPGMRESMTAGIPVTIRRANEAPSGGNVLPIAWNMLEDTNTSPDPTNVQEMI